MTSKIKNIGRDLITLNREVRKKVTSKNQFIQFYFHMYIVFGYNS